MMAAHCLHRWNTPENIELDWKKFQDKKNSELQRLNGVYDKLLAKAGVKYIEGRGKLVDAHTVDVDGKRYTVRGGATADICTCFMDAHWRWQSCKYVHPSA